MSELTYVVKGRDEYHDRGIREFDCSSAECAARSYLQAHVEDWRGDRLPDCMKFSLQVWRSDQPEQGATAFCGFVMAKPGQKNGFSVSYDVQQEDTYAQDR